MINISRMSHHGYDTLSYTHDVQTKQEIYMIKYVSGLIRPETCNYIYDWLHIVMTSSQVGQRVGCKEHLVDPIRV